MRRPQNSFLNLPNPKNKASKNLGERTGCPKKFASLFYLTEMDQNKLECKNLEYFWEPHWVCCSKVSSLEAEISAFQNFCQF